MSRSKIYTNSDNVINLTVTDKDSGDPFDLSAVEGYIIILYYVQGGKVLNKFSKNTMEGYDDIIEDDAAGGLIHINLSREVTKSATPGDIDLEILVQSSNSEFEDSKFNSIRRCVEVGTIESTSSKKINTL